MVSLNAEILKDVIQVAVFYLKGPYCLLLKVLLPCQLNGKLCKLSCIQELPLP